MVLSELLAREKWGGETPPPSPPVAACQLLYKKANLCRSFEFKSRIGYSKMIGILEKISFTAVEIRGVFIVGLVCFFALAFRNRGQNLLLQHA